MTNPIRINTGDLHSADVDSYVEMQNYLRRDVGPVGSQPWIVRVIYANWFYLAMCSMVGGLVGWALLEPWIDDNVAPEEQLAASILMFPVVSASIGLFLGAAEGIICRNLLRAVRCGAIGLAVGFVGGFIALIPTGIVFSIMQQIALSLWDDPQPNMMPTGLALLVLMMGRAAAWSIVAIPSGMGQGIALGEKKVVLNGLVGALLGGLIGGLLFDPIAIVAELPFVQPLVTFVLALTSGIKYGFVVAVWNGLFGGLSLDLSHMVLAVPDGQAVLSRAIGCATVGAFVGTFVGLIEGWTKTAWLLMQKGPLAGKQFILYKDTTVLGSSPKADIYLFKDDAIEPRHALITNRAGRFEIEDCGTPDGTYVNGIPVTRARLNDGDQVVVGKTVLEFSMKETTR